MATTTPNFGWQVPTSTDYVKDGAVAIETLGDAIDASLVDLKGGTTGQVLSKATNTDMDFAWVDQDDANAIQNAIVDAKGDLITATAADTPARLAVGTNGQVLTADSTTATGLKWAIASGGLVPIGSYNLSGSSTSINNVFTSSYAHYLIVVSEVSSGAGVHELRLRASGTDTTANYQHAGLYSQTPTGSGTYYNATSAGSMILADGQNTFVSFDIYNPQAASNTGFTGLTSQWNGTVHQTNMWSGIQTSSTQFDGFTIFLSSGTFSSGTVDVYGYAKS